MTLWKSNMSYIHHNIMQKQEGVADLYIGTLWETGGQSVDQFSA